MQWKIESLGINSNSTLSGSNGDANSFNGSMWKFASQETQALATGETEPPKLDSKNSSDSSLDLKDIENGFSLPPDNSSNESLTKNDEPVKIKESDLERMNRAELQDMASAVGVANIEMTKKELIAAILQKA